MKLDAITGKIQRTLALALAGAAVFATVQAAAEAGRAQHTGPAVTASATPLDDPWHPGFTSAQRLVTDDPWHPSPVSAQEQVTDDPWHPAPSAA
ncbi:hypothetical protein AB0467_07925 [Streptomyces sp. NPDC052095]|uniref:hypothetical protein n=1 Tax=unclassified Streptomyces TaxID=2593676 RepID=UPI00344C5EA4